MATPFTGGIEQAAKLVQQQLTKATEATQQPKTGASKFDQAMVNKAEATAAADPVAKVQATELMQAIQKTKSINPAQKAGRPDDIMKQLNAFERGAPVQEAAKSAKPTSVITQMVTQVEHRNAAMGDFINKAIDGKIKLNQQQLLGLQARVAEYSMELDLTGKVVEKATSGLKDTLRTQV